MEKPTLVYEKPSLVYDEVIAYIEYKYNINTYDYAKKFDSSDFEKETGLNPWKCPNISGKYVEEWQEDGYEGWTIYEGSLLTGNSGKKIKATKEQYEAQFQEYYEVCRLFEQWKKDNNISDEYLNFWHWMIDYWCEEVSEGVVQLWDIKNIISSNTTPIWVKEITQYILDEFGEYLEDDKYLRVKL